MEQPAAQVVAWMAMLADPARLRVLRLLEREELSVGELARVTQLPQSTMSRHLKALLGGGWVRRRVEGTAGYYRLVSADLPEAAADLWRVVQPRLVGLPGMGEDDHRLAEVLLERATDSRAFFGRVAGEWDHLRTELFGTAFTAEALLSLLRDDLVVADLGCGTGNMSHHLAPLVRRVIAVDQERAMLEAARVRLSGHDNVELVEGDLLALPLPRDAVDVAVICLVLHHLPQPQPAVHEAARVLKAGGMLLIVDMLVHDRESYRFQMGHRHLGFSEEVVQGWAEAAGLRLRRFRRLPADTAARGPGLFAALLERPASLKR
jgi:ArsR family transcriptional regulator